MEGQSGSICQQQSRLMPINNNKKKKKKNQKKKKKKKQNNKHINKHVCMEISKKKKKII